MPPHPPPCLLPQGTGSLKLVPGKWGFLLQGYIREVRKNSRFKAAKPGVSETCSAVLTVMDCFHFLPSRIIGASSRM